MTCSSREETQNVEMELRLAAADEKKTDPINVKTSAFHLCFAGVTSAAISRHLESRALL